MGITAEGKRRGGVVRCVGVGRALGRRAAEKVRTALAWVCRGCRIEGGLFGHGRKGDGEEETKDGEGTGDEEGQGVQVLIALIVTVWVMTAGILFAGSTILVPGCATPMMGRGDAADGPLKLPAASQICF